MAINWTNVAIMAAMIIGFFFWMILVPALMLDPHRRDKR